MKTKKTVTTNFQKPSNKLVETKKIAQCFCQSFYDEHGIIHNCTCGKCGVTLDQLLKRIEALEKWNGEREKFVDQMLVDMNDISYRQTKRILALEKWKIGKDKAYPNSG